MDEQITLIRDWDILPKLKKDGGHHIIRENENSILIDFLTRRDEGSLLVCGNRGIGKTSLIITAINKSLKIRKKLIPILIKATSIHFESKDENLSILKQLIKSLYENLDGQDISKEVKKNAKELYHNSIAQENYQDESFEKSSTKETIFKTRFNVIPVSILIIYSLFLNYELFLHSWLSLIPLVIGVILFINFIIITTNKSTNKKSIYRRQYYNYATLQSDFEKLLNSKSNEDYKILFILDEFDKIHEPMEKIKNLKMLINQGNALFIFITVPDDLKNITNKTNTEYTLFSQILFLKRPLFNEMECYLDKIVYSFDNKIKNNPKYKNLKNYLCYISHTDFFELYKRIRDLMYQEQDKILLSLELNNDNITKANLQKAIGYIYERKQQNDPEQWKRNDEILELLYATAKTLENFTIYQKITTDDLIKNIANVNMTDSPQNISIISDFLNLLAKQGYLSSDDNINYLIIGYLSQFNTKGIFVDEEKIFIKEYEKFRENIICIANINSKFIKKSGSPFNTNTFNAKWNNINKNITNFNLDSFQNARELYSQLKNNNPSLIPANKLQHETENIISGINVLKGISYGLLIDTLKMQFQDISPINHRNLSDNIFKNLDIPNQSLVHTTFGFTNHNIDINKICIIRSPSIQFLNVVSNKSIPRKNLIICLIDQDEFSEYSTNSYLIDSMELLKTRINAYSQSGMPKTNIIFFAMRSPLQFIDVENLIKILKNLPSKT